MSDSNILIHYPKPGGHLNLIQGLSAWFDLGGQLALDMVVKLLPLDHETHVEPIWLDSYRLQSSNLRLLADFAAQSDLYLSINAPWFTMSIGIASYHLAVDPLIFLSYDPTLWGLGDGGIQHADSALLAFAKATGAAYVLAVSDLGYEKVRQRFVLDGQSYRFVLPSTSRKGHRIRWIDVCHDLGGKAPAGYTEASSRKMSHGYVRHELYGTFSPSRSA